MSKPKITENPSGYYLEWEPEKIAIEVTRLKQKSDRITGELLITTTAPGCQPHLHQASFNFNASTSRERLAKQLKPRYNVDWDSILEQLCVYTLRNFRSGTPVEEIWTSTEARPPEYLLHPFIIKNYPVVIFGDPSAGKSTLAQLFMTILTLPWIDNEYDFRVINEPCPCLLLDYETDRETVEWQIGCLQRGMGLPEFSIHYRRCFLPLADDIQEIIKAIERAKAQILIIDSIGPACGGELNEAGPAIAYHNALRKLKITTLALAHNPKNTEGNKKSVYGSIYFQALSRSIWEIKKVQEADEDEIEIGLFHRKPPPFSKISKPLGLRFKFHDNMTIVERQNPRTVDEFLKHMSAKTQIIELLRQHPMPFKEISTELADVTNDALRQAVSRLKRDKKIMESEGVLGLVMTNTL